MSSVRIENLSKSYGTNKVLDNISLEIENGKFITLLGPSGCGKSTLLRCIAGLNEVDDGKVYFDGEDVTEEISQKRNIGMVFQNYALFPNLTVKENVAFGLRVRKASNNTIEAEVAKYIKLVDLEGKEESFPHQLSGGQRQRVALARALVLKPRILLLDEPLSALDAKIRKSLRLQIRSIQKDLNITTVFVTHDQEEALIISDEIFVMNGGKIAQQGTAESIYTKPVDSFVAGFIGNYNIMSGEFLSACSKVMYTDEYAIRPEVIRIGDSAAADSEIVMNGMVTDVILLGSVMRYAVMVMNREVIVDTLNEHEDRVLKLGEKVILSVPEQMIQKIG